MRAELPNYVLDSFAVLSHLQDESGRGRVVDLLEQAQQGKCRLLLSLINLGEVCYVIERRRGLREVQLTLAAMDRLPIEILPVDRDDVLVAAHLKASHPISFADAFAAAAAHIHSAIILTGDPEFKALAPILRIEWLMN